MATRRGTRATAAVPAANVGVARNNGCRVPRRACANGIAVSMASAGRPIGVAVGKGMGIANSSPFVSIMGTNIMGVGGRKGCRISNIAITERFVCIGSTTTRIAVAGNQCGSMAFGAVVI